MQTIVGILTIMRKKNCSLGLSKPEKKAEFLDIFILKISRSAELSMELFLLPRGLVGSSITV